MKLTAKAVRLLRRVQRHILAEPKRVDMSIWRLKKDETFGCPRRGFPTCGTVACIGGWTEELYREKHPRSRKDAGEILGISYDEKDDLFFDHRLMYTSNGQTIAHARAVAAHIDRFIEKH